MRLKFWSWIFLPFVLAVLHATGVAQIATTQVDDTIYQADGTVASGTVLIAWPAFTTSAGDQVPAGSTSAVIGTGGALSVQLVPNSGAIPVGTYYTVTYHLDDNSVTRQYWVVPQSATPVKIAAIESTVLPVSIAIQTATKSYVDTAIAAATTGHPLDSSPLVLKAGDTMTGPLVLPGDPVASLQASTKHYVDAALAAGLATAGTLTGQTPDYVPLATSSTASSTSSHFFEQNGTSGVTNPFNMSAHAPNCNWASGPSFTRYKCFGIDSYDDGSTNMLPGGSRNLAAFTLTHNAWGPAGGNPGGVGVENRTSTVWADSNNGALVTPGIKTVHFSNTSSFGIGDFQGMNYDFTCAAGVAYASDQGCQNYWRLWETAGPWSATITGGTNTAPTFTNSGGCTGLENQACAPVPGGWMRDTSVGKGNGHATGIGYSALSGAITWASTVTTDFAPPASTAYGYSINANLSPSTTWDAPIAQTFTLQAGAGSFAAGDHACVIGTSFTEQNVISAVSGTSPTQTITIPLAMPETSVAIFKGDCMVMTLDTDASNGVTYALPVVSIDGSSLIFPYEKFSTNGANQEFPSDGVTWAHFDGGSSSGIHLYAGARILTVGTIAPTAPFPFNAPYLTVTLSPNSAFASGDTIDSPHYQAQKVDGLELFAGQTMAPTSAANLTALRLHITGQGAAATSALFRGYNDAPTTYYKPFGGALNEPGFLEQSGPFDSYLVANYAPNSTAFYIKDHQPGQSSYEIWRDPSWGSFSIDSSSTFHFNNASLGVGGSVSSAGIVSASLGFKSGYGDGAGNLAGVEFPFPAATGNTSTWLAPCSVRPLPGEPSSLCVSSQGAARSAWGVTPDRDLSARQLSATNGSGTPVVAAATGSSNNVAIDLSSQADSGAFAKFGGTGAGMHTWFAGSTGTAVSPGSFALLDVTSGYWSWKQTIGAGGTGSIESPAGVVECWSPNADITVTPCDAALSRHAPGVVRIGNGMLDDASGGLETGTVTAGSSVSAAVYKGPATAPTGACSTVGWAFSQDGHISYCDGTTWIQKM